MRIVSFNARAMQDAQSTDELEVVLVVITHPLIPAPVRLSSDTGTERLSDEPPTYGTVSTWHPEDPEDETESQFLFIMMGAQVPDETDTDPASGQLVLEILDSDIAKILTSTIEQATVHMAIVLASSPTIIEHEFLGMKLVSADGDSGQVALSFSRDPIENESYPTARTTKERFPGMHQ